MKSTDTKTVVGLSDLDRPMSVGQENDALAREPSGQQDLGERAVRHEAVASLRLLWESRRFLGRVAGSGLLLSALISLFLPNRYQSVARLMPPDNQSSSSLAMAAAALSGGAAGGLGGIASEMLGVKSPADLLVGVLGSRTVEDKLIQHFDLRKVYGVRRGEDARKILTAQTDVSVDKKSQILSIAVTDKSPQRAAAMAQAYVEELNRTLAEVSTSSARRERIFLEGRLQAVTQDLETSEKEFSQFASKNTAIDIKEQGRAMVDAAATLQGQYIAARAELEGLRQLYTDGNVRVRSVQARVDELQNQLMKVAGKDDYSVLTPTDSLYPSIRKLPLLGVPYADLYRKTKVENAVFETLTEEYEMAKVQEAKELPVVKVLDPPNVPERKSSPHRALIALLGTGLAFMLGVSWLFGRGVWDSTLPSDPGRVLAQEVFDTVKGAIPWVSRNGSELHKGARKTGAHVVPPGVRDAADK